MNTTIEFQKLRKKTDYCKTRYPNALEIIWKALPQLKCWRNFGLRGLQSHCYFMILKKGGKLFIICFHRKERNTMHDEFWTLII